MMKPSCLVQAQHTFKRSYLLHFCMFLTHYADDWPCQWMNEYVPLRVERATPHEIPLQVKY